MLRKACIYTLEKCARRLEAPLSISNCACGACKCAIAGRHNYKCSLEAKTMHDGISCFHVGRVCILYSLNKQVIYVWNAQAGVRNRGMWMKEAMRYLMGWPGPSGYGSASTAEQVTRHLSPCISPDLTALITGTCTACYLIHFTSLSALNRSIIHLIGGTSGIGLETARVLAKSGVRIVLAVRDPKRGREVKETILRESSGPGPAVTIHVLQLDLSSVSSVSCFSSRFLSLHLPLNILM